MRFTRREFLRLVRLALEELPTQIDYALENVAILVEDWPGEDDPEVAGPEGPYDLFGVYSGVPLPEREGGLPPLPDRITLFQRPIEEDSEDEDEIRAAIGETLIHEVGHYFGLSEEEIEEIEERYWRGDTLGPDEDDDEEEDDE